ncbi:MAG: hypothetical protein KDN22_13245, partial [Verrucomicrobiae bacterium]|nr:hypothetical protein [Verrucomicrobiae bacterium]
MIRSFLIFLTTLTTAVAQDSGALTLISGDRERSYHVHVPRKIDQEKAAPLLLCFHGAGGNGL